MANANAETGYLSKAFRGATKIEHVQSFELPEPSTNLIPMPELEQANNVVPKIGGSTELGEATVTYVQDKDATVQNAIVDTFYSGDKTPEAWSFQDCNSGTGAAEVTYSFNGFISSAKPGPFSTSEGKLGVVKITLSSAITIVRA
jgi:hypothetical protein